MVLLSSTMLKQNHDTNRDNKTIQESQEVILLRKYRWVLLKNQDNINYSDKRYYHSSLRMYADTYTIEKLFLSLDPKFNIIRDVKEKYIRFNNTHFSSEDEVMQELLKMIEEFKSKKRRNKNEKVKLNVGVNNDGDNGIGSDSTGE